MSASVTVFPAAMAGFAVTADATIPDATGLDMRKASVRAYTGTLRKRLRRNQIAPGFGLGRRRLQASQIFINPCGRLASFSNRPDDQRLAAPHIASGKHPGHGRHI